MIDIIREVKERTNILEIIELYSSDKPKRTGSRYFIKSPFQNEKTPSCAIFTNTNTFKDFSSGKGGDSIKFVELLFGLKPIDAAKKIAADFRLPIQVNFNMDKQSQERYKKIQKERSILSTTAELIENDIDKLFNTLSKLFNVFKDLRMFAEEIKIDGKDEWYQFIRFNEKFMEEYCLKIINPPVWDEDVKKRDMKIVEYRINILIYVENNYSMEWKECRQWITKLQNI